MAFQAQPELRERSTRSAASAGPTPGFIPSPQLRWMPQSCRQHMTHWPRSSRRRVEVECDDEPTWVTVKGCGGKTSGGRNEERRCFNAAGTARRATFLELAPAAARARVVAAWPKRTSAKIGFLRSHDFRAPVEPPVGSDGFHRGPKRFQRGFGFSFRVRRRIEFLPAYFRA